MGILGDKSWSSGYLQRALNDNMSGLSSALQLNLKQKGYSEDYHIH